MNISLKRNAIVFLTLLMFAASSAFASNFGDLPAVLPVFFLGLAFSFAWAIWSADKAKSQDESSGFRWGVFFGVLVVGSLFSLVLLVAAFLLTL